MKAFVEWLYKPPSKKKKLEGAVGLLRVGPQAEKFGDPYDGSITFRVENGLVDCKGLHNYLGQCTSCGSQISLSRAHVVAGLRELRNVTGLNIHWVHKGKESFMSAKKKPLPFPGNTINADGTLNIDELTKELMTSHEQLAAGHYKVQNAKASETKIEGGVHRTLEWDLIG